MNDIKRGSVSFVLWFLDFLVFLPLYVLLLAGVGKWLVPVLAKLLDRPHPSTAAWVFAIGGAVAAVIAATALCVWGARFAHRRALARICGPAPQPVAPSKG